MSKNNLLQPSIVFDCFAEVNKIPRPSKKGGKNDCLSESLW